MGNINVIDFFCKTLPRITKMAEMPDGEVASLCRALEAGNVRGPAEVATGPADSVRVIYTTEKGTGQLRFCNETDAVLVNRAATGWKKFTTLNLQVVKLIVGTFRDAKEHAQYQSDPVLMGSITYLACVTSEAGDAKCAPAEKALNEAVAQRTIDRLVASARLVWDQIDSFMYVAGQRVDAKNAQYIALQKTVADLAKKRPPTATPTTIDAARTLVADSAEALNRFESEDALEELVMTKGNCTRKVLDRNRSYETSKVTCEIDGYTYSKRETNDDPSDALGKKL